MLGGCGLLARSSFEDDTVLTAEITSVRIDGSSDSVALRGDDTATEVSVHRKVEHRGSRPEDPSHRVEDGVLVLGGCGQNCSVDYTVDLPAGLPVSGETSNGAISVSRVGVVDVRTDNGTITVDGATGQVTVRSSNGEIGITLDTPQDVQAEANNGAITVTVPDGSYQVSAQTDNGSTDIGITHDPAGEHRLDLTTDNGSITVRPA
jgi:hypothetical protein